jgi:serine/threonine-protein kinase RsbW
MTVAPDPPNRARLEIPGEHTTVQLARLVAAGIAGRLGFDVDEIEDLRIGVDECCVAILDHVTPGAALALEYRWDGDVLQLRGLAAARPNGGTPEVRGLTAQILAAVVDEHQLWRDGEHVGFSLRKRRSDVES